MFGRRPSPTSDLEIGSIKFDQQSTEQLPDNHKKVDSNDINDCPYMKIKQTQQYQQQQQQQEEAFQEKVLGKDGQPKKKKARGGCPLMPSEHKRNPGLYHMKELYETDLITLYSYMLEQKGLMSLSFNNKEVEKGPFEDRRLKFNTYPIYLKHTLFQDEENTKKMRSLEVAQRFFVYDKFREQGNKRLFKGEYDDAIKYYERALGCFKWLDYIEPKDSDDELDQQKQKDTDTQEEKKNQFEDQKLLDDVKEYQKQQKELKKQYKSIMKIYTDENVKLTDPADIEDSNDREMIFSIIFTLYLNMSVCYMHMGHFALAQCCIDDASKISPNNSQLLFRKSQIISYNKSSDLQQLFKAKAFIENAIEMTNFEKVFQQGQGILKLMNLSNAKEIYVEQAHYVMKRIKEQKEFIVERVRKLFTRALEIQEIEQEMIEDGKIPFEDGVTNIIDEDENAEQNISSEIKQDENNQEKLYRVCSLQLLSEQQEFSIVQEMVNKYYRIIQFFMETKKPDQIRIAKRELQSLLPIFYEMSFYMNLDFIGYQQNQILKELQNEFQIDLTDKKIIRRLIKLSREQVSEIFGKSIFNFEVLDYAMKDYFKSKEKKQKNEMDNEKDQQLPQKKSWISKQLISWEFLYSVILIIILAILFVYLKNGGILLKEFNPKK